MSTTMDLSRDSKREGKLRSKMTEVKQETLDSFLCWLARHPLDQIPRDTTGDVYLWKVGSVMVVRHDETLPSVFKKLVSEGFLSAPVFRDGNYLGYIDMLDLVKYTTQLFQGETDEAWTDFFEKRDDFRTATVEEVMKTTHYMNRTPAIDPFRPCLADSSMLSVWERMGRTGIHRVALLNRQDELMGIMTESMCISLLRQNLFRIGEMKALSVERLVTELPSDVLVVQESDTAMEAFNLMSDKQLSGLPVVDDDGVLTGVISIRDLRGVGASGEEFSKLFLTVKDYKKQVRREFPRQAPRTHYSHKLVPVSGLYVTPSSTLNDVISLMNDGNIHRVFVCEEESAKMGKPRVISVISQKDIIMQLLVECGLPPSEL